MPQVIIAVVITLIITAVAVWFISTEYHKKVANTKIGNAEEQARGIIDEAVKNAEDKKREAMLEIKEETIRSKNEIDKEIKERRNEIQRNERRIVQKEENLDKKLEAIEKREASFRAKEEDLKKQKVEIAKLNEQRVQELERISGLTSEQAKEYLLKTVEEDVKIDTAKMIKEMEAQAKEEVNKKAKDYVVTAIQKCAADHVAETTISVVQLPNDEMKGRIIGREGRNIRTLETMTGVDLIIDDATDLQSKTVGPKVYRGNEISHLQSFWREWHGAQAADSSIHTLDALRQEILPPMHHERPCRRMRWAAARHDAQAKLLHN